jgi:outer membrane protease
MTKYTLLATSIVLAMAGTASAGGSKGSMGVGFESQINGLLDGISANYDMGEFHLGGFLAFSDGGEEDDTDISFGGRFYYHVHSTAMADFGIGGSFGVGLIGDRMAGVDNNATLVYIEPGFQIRAFVASNVALSFTGGLTLGVADADGVAVTGQLNAVAGVHYYFF